MLTSLRRMMPAVLLAGLFSGLLLTAVQKIQISPIILQAEVYEDAADAAAEVAAAVTMPPASVAAMHVESAAAAQVHEHAHAWQPQNGIERTLFTVLANVTIGIAFALLLGAVFVLRGDSGGWRVGLCWGLAGYVVFFAAPALGLHPEIPGTEAAPLADRQLWWLMTAVCSAAGLGLLVLVQNKWLKLLGLVLLLLPHAIGAPQALTHGSVAPEALAHAFIYATALANVVFWLALGGSLAYLYKKLA